MSFLHKHVLWILLLICLSHSAWRFLDVKNMYHKPWWGCRGQQSYNTRNGRYSGRVSQSPMNPKFNNFQQIEVLWCSNLKSVPVIQESNLPPHTIIESQVIGTDIQIFTVQLWIG